jgi:hypothetical protein
MTCPNQDKDHIAACGCLCQGTRKLDRVEAEKAQLQADLDEAIRAISLYNDSKTGLEVGEALKTIREVGRKHNLKPGRVIKDGEF